MVTAADHGERAEAKGGSGVVIVYSTFPDMAAAERAARALVEARLVACANLWPIGLSVYRWQGAVVAEPEVAALFKTDAAVVADAMAALKGLHPYTVPAMVVWRPEQVSPDYAAWLVGEVGAITPPKVL